MKEQYHENKKNVFRDMESLNLHKHSSQSLIDKGKLKIV